LEREKIWTHMSYVNSHFTKKKSALTLFKQYKISIEFKINIGIKLILKHSMRLTCESHFKRF